MTSAEVNAEHGAFTEGTFVEGGGGIDDAIAGASTVVDVSVGPVPLVDEEEPHAARTSATTTTTIADLTRTPAPPPRRVLMTRL